MKKGVITDSFPDYSSTLSKIQNSTSDFLQSPSGAFSQFFPTSLDLAFLGRLSWINIGQRK